MRIDDLSPGPTFQGNVTFPVTGVPDTVLKFTFRTRNRTAMVLLLEKMKTQADDQALLDVLAGWELEDEFNAENVARFCDTFPAAAVAIIGYYVKASGYGAAGAAVLDHIRRAS